MNEMTLAEMSRVIARHESEHRGFVTRELHDQIVADLRADVREIKESLRWAMRGILSMFLAIVVQVVMFFVAQGPPG
jgi:hypothetical protein